jgi:UDP-2,3-diacylglucosamine pyrophosphatase LpxH
MAILATLVLASKATTMSSKSCFAERKGCRVIYVPGNHDEFARHFVGHAFGGVEVMHEASHTTATGLKLWVVHGDHFDGVIQCAKWLAYVGDWLYELTLKINRHLNSFRARLGLDYWSLSAYLKLKVKKSRELHQ